MDQSAQRSVPLKAVGFTSPPVTNKGNRIRVLSPQALLDITVQEWFLFSFMEPVYLLLPVWPSPPPLPPGRRNTGGQDSDPTLTTVSVDRLVTTTQKTAENRLTVMLPESPGRILQCRVKNITLNTTVGPAHPGTKLYAKVVYSYDIIVQYQDKTGQNKQATFPSGTRSLGTVIPPPAKHVEVCLRCLCNFC